jgi:predicted metal-dependent phosphoesterase TrpH
MQFSDLHIHSKFSDGILCPEQIIDIASKKKIGCLSITDHDTVESQYFIERLGAPHNLTIIPGLEISTEYKDKEIHILAYFIDIHDDRLKTVLNKTSASRLSRAKEIIDRLNSVDVHISYDDIVKETSVGRLHIAKVLVAKGYVNNTKEAFQQFLVKGKPAYVDRYKINYKDALKLIKDCKGVSVLAHPGEIYKGIPTDEIIREFKVYGLKGIEVFHPSHTLKQTNDYYNLAIKHSLLITGGSDCHGGARETELLVGSYGIDEKLTHKFLKFNYNK